MRNSWGGEVSGRSVFKPMGVGGWGFQGFLVFFKHPKKTRALDLEDHFIPGWVQMICSLGRNWWIFFFGSSGTRRYEISGV